MRRWLRVNMVVGLVAVLLAQGVSAGSLQGSSERLFTVVFQGQTLPVNAGEMVRAAGGKIVASAPELGGLLVSGPSGLMATLAGSRGVAAVSPTLQVSLPTANVRVEGLIPASADPASADLYNEYQWDIKQVTAGGASYARGTGSHRTVVGIIDSGYSTEHPDLAANFMGGRNYVPDGPGGTVVPGDLDDRHGHGSHLAGTIAGNGRILGVGPDLGFRVYRIFGADGGTSFFTVAQAILAAAADHVDVINMSLGGYDIIGQGFWTDPDTGVVYRFNDVADFVLMSRAVRSAVQSGVVVVAASGNDAANIANPASLSRMLNAVYGPYGYTFLGAAREVPGTLPGVVTVSATGPDQSPATYTNFGPGAIDLAAPGGDFKRYPDTAPTPWYWDMCLSASTGDEYAWMAGTSMATPKVAAVAALVVDQARGQGQRLMPAQVVAQLQKTAVDLGKPGYDPFYGQGMVNAYRALQP